MHWQYRRIYVLPNGCTSSDMLLLTGALLHVVGYVVDMSATVCCWIFCWQERHCMLLDMLLTGTQLHVVGYVVGRSVTACCWQKCYCILLYMLLTAALLHVVGYVVDRSAKYCVLLDMLLTGAPMHVVGYVVDRSVVRWWKIRCHAICVTSDHGANIYFYVWSLPKRFSVNFEVSLWLFNSTINLEQKLLHNT